jgi:hypothetical protein
VTLLDLPGTLTRHVGSWRLEPPPAGAARFELSEHEDDLFTVRVTAEPSGPTRAELDAILGAGQDVVRIHWDSPYPICYRVTVDGAPYSCDVFAYFTDQPVDSTASTTVLLRRQRSDS